jgi:hypothetical protein
MKLQKRYKEQAATRVKVDQKNPSKKQKNGESYGKTRYETK